MRRLPGFTSDSASLSHDQCRGGTAPILPRLDEIVPADFYCLPYWGWYGCDWLWAAILCGWVGGYLRWAQGPCDGGGGGVLIGPILF